MAAKLLATDLTEGRPSIETRAGRYRVAISKITRKVGAKARKAYLSVPMVPTSESGTRFNYLLLGYQGVENHPCCKKNEDGSVEWTAKEVLCNADGEEYQPVAPPVPKEEEVF